MIERTQKTLPLIMRVQKSDFLHRENDWNPLTETKTYPALLVQQDRGLLPFLTGEGLFKRIASLESLHDHRHTHTATYTHGSQTAFELATFHLMQKGNNDSAACRPDRMSK